MTVPEAQLEIQNARRDVFCGMSYKDAGIKYKEALSVLNRKAAEVARRNGRPPKRFSLKQFVESPGLF